MGLHWVIMSIVAGASPPSATNEYLTSVTSEVYLTTGTPREIALRASTCISQHLAAGTTDSQLIVSSDLDGGTIVAHSAIQYSDRLIQWKIRSIFTFQARDGRFRIEQTNLERFGYSWGPIGKWRGSGWQKAEAAYGASAAAVAQCVIEGTQDNW